MAKRPAQMRRTKQSEAVADGLADPESLLAEYDRKRDFHTTAEPRPGPTKPHKHPVFVVQEHHASTLHYDFRLESDGVLKSWAVPKQPSTDPSVKRLAVRVEDHPLAYADFTGDIPAGQYGAGHVEIWDRGTYTPAGTRSDGNASIAEEIADGKVEFDLYGEKLKGAFVLVRAFGRGGKENWLLIKRNDRFATSPRADGDGKADERPAPRRTAAGSGSAPSRSGRSTRKNSPRVATAVSRGKPEWVEFTHTDKVMFPDAGITKGDVLDYYERVAGKLLPHLRDRPITLERLPDGVKDGAPRFWQKNTPSYYPKWIPRIELPSERGKPVQYALVNDVETLLYLVNQGALTFHPFLSRVANLDRPDYVLFDLDPSGAPFADVVKIARQLKQILDGRSVDSFVKTSGKSGLHVLVRWEQPGGYDEARAWALENAEALVAALPNLATVERTKAEREGRVYVDVMQNARGHHAVPPYVLRAVPEATVSTPLEWKELAAKLNPKRFTVKAASPRFEKQKADPMGSLTGQ